MVSRCGAYSWTLMDFYGECRRETGFSGQWMPMSDVDEGRWRAGMAAGDESVCREVYRRHAQPLFRYVLGMTSADRAEDLVQKAFVRFFSHARRNPEAEAGAALLYRTARNLALNAARDEQRERGKRQEAALARDEAGPGDEALRRLIADEETRRLYRAIHALPAEQRDVVLLRIHAEHSFEQIADLTGAPMKTVYRRYQLAVDKLKQELSHEH